MDIEARAQEDQPEALRLWLRMLTCTQLIEKEVRTLLRERFGTTLPRYDLLAQLDAAPQGLKMNELSRRMMVTGGNVTGITDQLAAEGLVDRVDVEGDRRAWRVRLTPRGRRLFRDMARRHDECIEQAFSQMGERELAALYRLLGKIKDDAHARAADQA